MEIIPPKVRPDANAEAPQGLHYREVLGGLMNARAEVRSRKAHPEVVVVIDGLTDLQKDTMVELLKNPNLEFRISAVDSEDGKDICLHIRNII